MSRIYFFFLAGAFCLGLTTAWTNVIGQIYNMENVIYLKDGSEIRGWILEQIPGEYVKVELVGGSILVYRQSEIEKITSEPTRYSRIIRKYNTKPQGIQYRDRGLYHFVATGFTTNDNMWGGSQLDVSLNYRAGYRFNQYLGLGLGVGIDEYDSGGIVPVFGEVSGDLLRRKRTPFYLAQAGYGIGVSTTWIADNLEGGLYYHLGAGLKVRTRSRAEWTFTMGYKSQQMTETLVQWIDFNREPVRTVRERTVRGIVYQVAIGF
ncbi:MAG: hypothetical protein SF052_00990 [Bacteroidia bacterium]|nr:hypothetical protein [Bacteroidia bacterium]